MNLLSTDIKSLLATYFGLTILFVILLSPLLFVSGATPIKGTYSKGTTSSTNQGFLWMSREKNYTGSIGVSSQKYDAAFGNAWTRVKNSTKGQSYMGRWINGISMYQVNNTGSWNANVDIMVTFADRGSDSFGQNYSAFARSDFCAYWGVSYPCGQRPTIEIHSVKWASASSVNKERLLMHETGHSHGMYDYCSGDSIMNNGVGTCNGGKWTALMSYQTTDRQGISNVYPQ